MATRRVKRTRRRRLSKKGGMRSHTPHTPIAQHKPRKLTLKEKREKMNKRFLKAIRQGNSQGRIISRFKHQSNGIVQSLPQV